MSKMSLTEATMLALQGKLVENKATTKRPTKRLKKENIDINVDDKTNVSVMNNETIVDTEDATIIVDKKENEFVPETSDGIVDDTTLPMEAPVDTVEVPVEGDETIIPEEVVDEPIVEPSEENAIDGDVDLPAVDDEEKEESKKIEAKERTTKDVYVVQGNYGQGWEDVFESEDRKDAKDRLKEYNENEKEYSHRLITRRVKKESKSTCEKCGKEVCECDKIEENKKLQETNSDDEMKKYYCSYCGKPFMACDTATDLVSIKCPLCGKSSKVKKEEKREFKFENKKLQEELTDETVEAAEKIAKEIRKVGCMNFQDIDNMAMEILGIDVDTYMNDQINIDIYSCLNYEGIFNNFGDGDFFTQQYAEEHPEIKEESKEIKQENVNIEISEDGKEVEVTTDEGEVVETKDETPDDVEEVEIEDELDENKKLNEEVTDDTIVKIEPRYLVGKDGKHFDQTVFFKVTYKVVKGYLIPLSEEIIGWTWGETDKYSGEGNNLKADYSSDLQVAVDDINKGDTSNYMTVDSLSENKKLNEDYSAAPFRDLMYDCMRDDIEPGDVMADRMLSAWSDDDCKWYCETYELVTPYKDFSDENEYYKDVYGQIRDITGQVVGEDDEDLEEAKHRKVESIKMIEARKNKKFEKATRITHKSLTKKTETTIKNIKGVNEALTKILKVEKVENAKIEEANGKILLKAKVLNENKVKGICFEMKEIANSDKFTRYSLQEIKSLKVENKVNDTKYTMLVNKKDNMLECRYIIKK